MNSVVHSADALRAKLETLIAVLGIVLLTRALVPIRYIIERFGSDTIVPYGQLLLYALPLVVLITHWRRGITVAPCHWPVIALVALSIMSTAWSVDPVVTFRSSLGVLGATIFGLMLATVFTVRQWVGLIAIAMALAAVLCLAVVVLWSDYGIMDGSDGGHVGAWRGTFVHKNILGRMMALGVISGVLSQPDHPQGKHIRLAGILLCAFVLVFSLSRTAWLITLFSLGVVTVAGGFRMRFRVLLPMAIVGAAVAVAAGYLLLAMLEPILFLIGRDLTFTGRTAIWIAMLDAFEARPLLGYGLDAFWSTRSIYVLLSAAPDGWVPNHAHNGWLELAVGLGLVGTALLALSTIVVIYRSVRVARHGHGRAYLFPIVFLLFLLSLSTVESVVLRQNNIFWALYCAVAFSVSSMKIAPKRHAITRNAGTAVQSNSGYAI